MMKTALVTGATRGIGMAISEALLSDGWRVIGLGRDFATCSIDNDNFCRLPVDILRLADFEARLREIEKNENITLLINNAGIGYFSLHEELDRRKIDEMVTLNLTAPMLACQLLLRGLKKRKGYIINISSVTARKSSPFAAAYAATKAAITSFSESLFEEGRKDGLRVTVVHPDMTKSSFYDKAFFRESDDESGYLLPECVAQAVLSILHTRNETIITEMTVRPQRHLIGRKENNSKSKK